MLMMQACKTPLFQVPGITDTAVTSKSISLVETPKSRRAWCASKSSRLTLPIVQPRLRLLYHDQSCFAPIVVHTQTRRDVYATKQTIHHKNEINKPMLEGIKKLAIKRPLASPQFVSTKQYAGYPYRFSYTAQNGPCLKLINPNKVLAYESKSSSTSIPVMKVQAPSFAESKLVSGPQNKVLSNAEGQRQKSPQQRDNNILKTISNHRYTSPGRNDEEYHGLLSQPEIKQEFETAAAMHYLASVVKKQASDKPRTKEMAQQTDEITKEEMSNESSPKKPKHLPPPDIFLKLRFAKDAGISLANVEGELRQIKNDFVNIADIDSKLVLNGLNQQKHAIKDFSPPSPIHQQPHEWLSANGIIAEHLSKVTKASSVKRSIKNNWSSAMQQMSSQLDVIDEMAENMQKDFRDTERLVKTVDNLTDVIAPSVADPIFVKLDQNLEFDSHEVNSLLESPQNLSPKSPRSNSYNTLSSPHDEILPYHKVQKKKGSQPVLKSTSNLRIHSNKYDQYRNRMKSALYLAEKCNSSDVETLDVDNANRFIVTQSPAQSSPISFEQELNAMTSQKHLLCISSKQDFQLHCQNYLQDELNELKESIIVPKTQFMHWKNRTPEEKDSIRKWMAKKRREQTKKYKEELIRLREKEKRPYQPKKNNMIFTINKQQASNRRLENVDTRIEEAMLLLQDLKSDQPNIPTEDNSSIKSIAVKRHGATSPGRHKWNSGRFKLPYQPLSPLEKYMASPSVRSISGRSKKIPLEKFNDSKNPPSISGSFSDISGLSGWVVSDEVKDLLYSSDVSMKPSKGVTFDLGQRHKTDTIFNDLQPGKSLNLTGLGIKIDEVIGDHMSQNTESLISEVDWSDVERLVASVNIKDE